LRGALQQSAERLAKDPKAANLHSNVVTDPRFAALRGLPQFNSLIEALIYNGCHRLFLTDWRSATADMRHFTIDSYLAELNVAIDEIGAPVDLVGLCQGGWLSLVYAARFPGKVRRLVLAGAPVDVSTPSELSKMVTAIPQPAFEQMVQRGDGLVSGEHMLKLWNPPFSQHDVEATLQRNLGDGSDEARMLLDRYERWDRATLDLPGTYYLEVTDQVFRQNLIAKGRFIALGRRIDLAEVRVPVFLLAGADDIVVPCDQAFATARLLGTQPAWLERGSEPCGHLSLFMGRKALNHSWWRIARWLQADIGDAAGARISA